MQPFIFGWVASFSNTWETLEKTRKCCSLCPSRRQQIRQHWHCCSLCCSFCPPGRQQIVLLPAILLRQNYHCDYQNQKQDNCKFHPAKQGIILRHLNNPPSHPLDEHGIKGLNQFFSNDFFFDACYLLLRGRHPSIPVNSFTLPPRREPLLSFCFWEIQKHILVSAISRDRRLSFCSELVFPCRDRTAYCFLPGEVQ